MKVRLEGIEIECNVDEFEEIRKRNLLEVNIKKNLEGKIIALSDIIGSVLSVFLRYEIKYTQKEASEGFIEFKTVKIKNGTIRIIFIPPNEVKIFRHLACVEPYSCDDMIVKDEERLKLLEDRLEGYIQEILKR